MAIEDQVEYFMEKFLRMNPNSVSPTVKMFWRIIKEAILKWEDFKREHSL